MTLHHRVLITVGLASILAHTASAAIPQHYRMTDLGTLGGPESSAEAINNASPPQVTGTSWLSDNYRRRAFIYTAGGSMISIDIADQTTFGLGINDAGDVVGSSDQGGFVYRNGVVTMLPPVSDTFTENQAAASINNNGVITGWAYAPTLDNTPPHAFRYSLADNSMVDLGTLGEQSTYSEGLAINLSGQIAGDVQDTTGWLQQAMFFDGAMSDIDAFSNSTYSYAVDLNDDAKVVGAISLALGNGYFDYPAFVYDHNNGATMTLLPHLPGSSWSEAHGINNLGQVVGNSLSGWDPHAVLWSDNQVVDLNTMLEPSPLTPYVVLARAEDINENGWIIANGYDTRTWKTHAYLLEPVWP